jgi:hypothetical protein
MKKCFVISPIGQPGSDVRKQADEVLDYIIEPALKDMGIEAVRADKLTDPGLITDQIIAAIVNYDLCIADLSGQNPNVFYELAIAQAYRRPVVLLTRAGEIIPFDVKNYRYIEYDLKSKSIRTKIPELKKQIAIAVTSDYRPPPLLQGKIISKSEGFRAYLINTRSEEFGDAPRFQEVVQQAVEYCCLMGISLRVWSSRDGQRVLDDLAARRVSVRILIMDGEHASLAAMINTELPSEDLEEVKRETERMIQYFRDIAVKNTPTFEVRRLVKGIPHFQLIVTERTALIFQYMISRTTADSPLLQCSSGSELYRVFLEEFETLWKLNEGFGAPSPPAK